MPHFLAALPKESITVASCFFANGDVIVNLILAEFFFTLGYLIAWAKIRFFNNSCENLRDNFSFPTTIGIICPLLSPRTKPSSCNPVLKKDTFLNSLSCKLPYFAKGIAERAEVHKCEGKAEV